MNMKGFMKSKSNAGNKPANPHIYKDSGTNIQKPSGMKSGKGDGISVVGGDNRGGNGISPAVGTVK